MLTDHGLVDQSNPIMVVANADQGGAVAEALAGVDGLETAVRAATRQGRRRARHATITERRLPPSTAFDTVEAARDAVHAVDGADALVGGYSAIYLDIEKRLQPRQPGDHPDRAASWSC